MHSDLHHGNVLTADRVYFIDWEYAQVGDPLLDLACVMAYYPRAVPHGALLLEASGLAETGATPEMLGELTNVFTLLTYLWYRARRVSRNVPATDLQLESAALRRLLALAPDGQPRHTSAREFARIFGCWRKGMATLQVIDRDGVSHDVECKPGLKVMEVLRELDYGVAAICGGMCSCATCHIYVDPAWADKLPPPMSDERDLLTELSHYRENSRLSCQVEITAALSGLKVTIAEDE